jgi:transglutaminase-like putative cysteine protease
MPAEKSGRPNRSVILQLLTNKRLTAVSARVLSQIVALGFVLLGLLAFSTRYFVRSEAKIAVQDSVWRLTYDVDFEVTAPSGNLRVSLPTSTRAAEVVVEEISTINLRDEIITTPISQNRELHVSTQSVGQYEIKAEYEIRLQPRYAWAVQGEAADLSATARTRFLRSEEQYNTTGSGVRRVLQEIPRGEMTDGEYVQELFEYCSQTLNDPVLGPNDKIETYDEVDSVLAFRQATPLGRARALVTLCRAAKIPARLITGFELRQSDNARPHVWVEVFYLHHWVPFDPTNGFARTIPDEFLPIRRDSVGKANSQALVDGTGVGNIQAKYTVMRLAPPEKLLRAEMRRPSQVFDLTRLPVEMHEVMSLMLLLPLGALITAIFRNIIGIRTLGTFAPALLAMSFIYAAWGTGLVILISVLIVGYIGRKALDRLHLLMVPRSSIVLTVIILCVVFGVSVIDYMAPASGVRAVLLPLVILTILIERFFVTAEEDGTTFAIQLVVGTFVVAAFCYLILSWEEIGQILLIYPELHFFTIAAFIWIGRYSGYRLVELWRFRDMVK